MRRHLPALCCIVAILTALPVLADDGKRPFTIEDFYEVKTLSHLELSPDGSWLVYDLKTTDLPRGKLNRDLFRVGTSGKGPRRLTWTEASSESDPVFSPDGKRLAFVAKRGDQEHAQIWVMDVSGGEAHALTRVSTGVSDLLWSPDGRYIAFTSNVYPGCGADDACNRKRTETRENGPLTAHLADELLYRHWNSWSDGKVAHVLVAEVETGDVRDLTPGTTDAPAWSLGGGLGYAFSPDGRQLCYTRNGDPANTHAWSTNTDLWIVPVDPDGEGRTRKAVNITAENLAWDGSPRYSPDGRYIAYKRQELAGFEADLFRLVVYDRDNGQIRVVTPEFDDWVEGFEWLADGTGFIFAAPFEGQTPLYGVALKGGKVKKLAEFAYLDDFALHPDGRWAYALRRSIGAPGEVWKLDLSGKKDPARLTFHNLDLEQEVDIRPSETLWVDSADGHRIQVFIVKPHGFDPSKKYPLVFNVHGGPQGMWADSFRGDWQVYPGAGYVTAFPNPHGSTGQGQAFTAQISGDWGGLVFDDLMTVIDALEELPYVDGDLMGAMGWSYGGYMMNWFQGHTDRFKCLASMMGIFDLRSFYLSTEELWFPEWDLGLPWSSKHYDTWNPAGAISSFKTPQLIVTGERDYRVPYTQGLMTFTALRRNDVPSRLIVLPDSGHWPGWYEMALYYTAHLDWFHRWLGGDPAPWSVEAFVDNAVFDSETGERIDGEPTD
jgi:dipeptidyl aminopeptidase/acylaminoacyl peptidase